MKYFTENTWSRLLMSDFRPRFFIETYIEKLSMYTPHFHQARLMNVFSACRETLTYIAEYRANDKNGAYLQLALDEIENCFKRDDVCKQLFISIIPVKETLFKNIRKDRPTSSQLSKLSVLCNVILAKEEDYAHSILSELRSAILDEEDLSRQERIVSRIYTLTGLYATYLLNKGYSPTYLFNRAEMFTREKNYSGRSFAEQFSIITERLRSYRTNFDIYFSLNTESITLPEESPSFSTSRTIPESITGSNLEKFKKDFDPALVIKITLESTDFVSASWAAKEKINKLLDAATALQLNPKVKASSHCVAMTRDLQPIHTKTLNIELLIGFLSSENGTHLSNINSTIPPTLSKLNDVSRDHLGRSLRYLRLARESTSLEQKLLNLWIALESIFSGGDASIIDNIIEYVPQIYAVSGIARRVIYLKDLLVKNETPTTPNIKSQIMEEIEKFDRATTMTQIFKILRNEALAIELFESLANKEHLKFRLKTTATELKNNKAIRERVSTSEADVTRQLRRIYFLRNKITHTGHFSDIRPQLITHLIDYLAVCYMAITESAVSSPPRSSHSLENLLVAYKMGVESIVNRAHSENQISEFSELIPKPVI